MAYITNIEENTARLYDKDKINVDRDLMIDDSDMDPKIESALPSLAEAAKNSMKKRKPIPDFHTSNKSFLNLYNDLYKMGIKNNKFFLRIYDKDLIGVNPYQKILPLDLQLKIILECMINPWYWLREICRIPEDGAPIEVGGGTQYQIDRNNAAAWYCYLNGIDHYQSKPRQCGKTQDALAKQNYAYHYGTISANFLFFNKDQSLAKINLYRFKCQRDLMPAFMQMKFIITEDGKLDKGTDNITTMKNPITNNMITVMPKPTSADSARKLGRGNTAAFHHYDEFDFIPFNMDIVNAAAFSYSKATENAIKNNSLYSRIYTSTPGDLDNRDGKAATEYIDKMMVWDDHMFDEPINKLKKACRSTNRNGIMFIEHTWKQLKKSMEWYETQCMLASYNQEVILREIELKRISGSNKSPFRREDIMFLNSHMKEPIKSIDYSNNLCPIHIYENINRKFPYILSIDPSEGLALDNNAFTLINPSTQRAAAEFQSPYISQPDMFKLCCRFLDEFCPKSLIIVEANKGRELINYFLESKYRTHLYYDIDKLNSKVVESTDPYGALKKAAYERRAYGFDTTRGSRPKLFAILENFVEERKSDLYTQYIVKDIIGLERKNTGRVEASEGHHDDNIMSYLIGLYVYFNASNLEEFGIRRGQHIPEEGDIELTPEQKKSKLAELAHALPDSLRDVFLSVVQEKDPVSASIEYEKELRREQERADLLYRRDEQEVYNGFSPDESEALWGTLDKNLIDSNFEVIENTKVDIDDWI